MEEEADVSKRNSDCESGVCNEKKSKKDNRRRSNFCAKRLSILTPFIDPEPHLEQDKGKENVEQEESCSDSANDNPEYVKFTAEIARFKEESEDWEQCLTNSEKAATQAKQNLINLAPILKKDVAMETKMAASRLIGQAPDYSHILQNIYNQANSALTMLDEICQVTELVDGVVQKTNKLLDQYSDQLGEVSIPSIDTPRTQIRQRLNVGTPRT